MSKLRSVDDLRLDGVEPFFRVGKKGGGLLHGPGVGCVQFSIRDPGPMAIKINK